MLTRMVSNLRTFFPSLCAAALLVFAPAILPAAGGPSSEASFFELYAKVIRAVDTSRIIDRVSVDQAAILGILDTASLRQAQVAALGDCLCPHLRAINTNIVIALV